MLSGFCFHQLLTIPSPPLASSEAATDPREQRAQVAVFSALTAAHADLSTVGADSALAVAWDRIDADRQVRILVGGNPRFPAVPEHCRDSGAVMFPPGAIAREMDAESVVAQWRRVPVWVRCTGRADSLWLQTPGGQARMRRGGFEDFIAHLPGRFVWLVVASPVPGAEVDDELAGLEVQLPRLRAREDSEPARIAVQRGEFRYRELSRAHGPGLWRVHVFVGGDDDASTRRAAGLLCSAADLDDLPYVLTPHPQALSADRVWSSSVIGTDGEARSPFVAGAELLAALARPPRRELPGIRMVEVAGFDLTPEHVGEIDLGAILDDADQPVARFTVGRETLNRHGFVAGATGSGKSQTVRHLLEGLHAAGVPWLVIEPAKAEYAAMAGRIDASVAVLRPGDPDAVPAGINPLEPEPGFPMQTHIDLIRALFLATFDAVDPFPQVLSHALTRCYTDLGWDVVSGEPSHPDRSPRHPRLSDLQATAVAVVEAIGYGREVTDNVRGFIDVRLGALRLGTPGRFFDGRYRIDIAALLSTNTVIEIEDVGDDADKAFLIGVVLIRVAEHLRVHRDNRCAGLAHVTVIEEAHRLLRRAEAGSPAARAVELFAALLAEIRAYGEGIIVAEQIPSKISPDVVKNTALKIVHRLPAAEDRDLVGSTMNLDSAQSRQIVSLPPGRAAVFTDGMDRPIRVEVPLGVSREARGPARTPPLSAHVSETPLTLRSLHRAHTLAKDPRLTLWIELMLIAHLVGRPSPRPNPDWLTGWTNRTEPAILAEAIDHRIRTAIDHRYTGLAAYFPPEQLLEHVCALAAAALRGSPTQCINNEFRWQAGFYRWVDVEHSLQNPALPSDRPHPDTAAWAQRGLHLPGATLAEQREMLHAHPDNWADPRIVTGPDPSLLVTTIDRLSRAASVEQRLRHATTHLHGLTRWPLALLPAPEDTAAIPARGDP
ncbi:ATP-binding protein [Nocardia nepalensis]|uniref:ATP-binding protein n=1 Tax=Nocardia nepalensis TaxID=3375448 RepID=UPI003B67B09F